jgi:catechol 2,3-dioxygenase-like lactoylglutathione lyase family enzyme
VSVQLNHTIVWCRDKQKSATFFTEVFGLPSATPFGPMLVVPLNNDVSIDFYENDGEISNTTPSDQRRRVRPDLRPRP